jgi:hypothetical protein
VPVVTVVTKLLVITKLPELHGLSPIYIYAVLTRLYPSPLNNACNYPTFTASLLAVPFARFVIF